MKHWTQAALSILALSTISHVATAQKGGDPTAKTMDTPATKTYTGCVAAGTTAGTFLLTHASEAMMGKDAMAKDMMANGTMAKGTMAKDAMSQTLALQSKSVDFSKHVGHQVSVAGTDATMAMSKPGAMATTGKADAMGKTDMKAPPTFSVTSLKMIAGSCGMSSDPGDGIVRTR